MDNQTQNLTTLQRHLGYQFGDIARLDRALTHRSAGVPNNERLEYLGDSILGFVIAEALFARFPEAREGELTRMRASLVRNETLAEVAHEIATPACVRLGRAALKGGSNTSSIYANALEAIIGALYLDSDFATVREVVLRLFDTRLESVSPYQPKDPKTLLQELLQQRGLPLPEYELIATCGADHAPTVTVRCRVQQIAANAAGGNRRQAEQNAAAEVLEALQATPPPA